VIGRWASSTRWLTARAWWDGRHEMRGGRSGGFRDGHPDQPFGALYVSRPALAHMRGRGYGRILHVASIAGKEGNAGWRLIPRARRG
jgi:NAD(P)-dependent dehydrogenase (short-subunit alcohol dehydrogenase family)